MSRLVRLWIGVALVLLGVIVGLFIHLLAPLAPPRSAHHPPYGISVFNPSYTGVDYYSPSEYFSGCQRWSWLTSCYTRNQNGGITAQHLLADDLDFITRNNLGRFQRIWIVLDQGIRWDANGDYQGFDHTYFSNLDDALAQFHARNIQVDAVLFEASKGTSDVNQFRIAALDGGHDQLRSGYLHALHDFAAHVAANPIDASTILVVDEFNESFWQGEQFGLSDSTIHHWIHDEYSALKSGDPSLLVTASDTTRLLKDYATWWPMYSDAVDVIDEHAYSSNPPSDARLWANARAFQRPWFVGEAGCGVGVISCTYDSGNTQCSLPSACAISIDSWWLTNLRNDGARAVLIEARQTAWGYPKGPNSQTLTAVGKEIAQLTPANPFPGPSPAPSPASSPAISSCTTGLSRVSTPVPHIK